MNDYFILHPNCIAVKGATRSSISDLQYNRIKLIPNLLFEVIKLGRSTPIAEIKKIYNHEIDDGIDRYFELLEKEDYGFTTSEPARFPEMNLEWHTPSVITNAIIDISPDSTHPFKKIIQELHLLGCVALQIRAYEIIDKADLYTILSTCENSRINSIELLLHNDNWLPEDISDICRKHRRIRSITFHNSYKFASEYLQDWDVNLTYIKKHIDSESHCGSITSNNFSANIKLFTESQKFNSCLNRKISIDRFGNIKNCPTMQKSHGNISDTSLSAVIADANFSHYWAITKDEIETCKDCEFRYVCTDCRAFKQDEESKYSKPSKCKYDPYSATWA